MVLVEVSDEDAVAAVPVEQGLDNSRSFGFSPFRLCSKLKLLLKLKAWNLELKLNLNFIKTPFEYVK